MFEKKKIGREGTDYLLSFTFFLIKNYNYQIHLDSIRTIIYTKFHQVCLTTDRTANSVDLDQTAPLVYTVCSDRPTLNIKH